MCKKIRNSVPRNRKKSNDIVKMSKNLLYDLPDCIKKIIYEYDDTYRKKYNGVLQQFVDEYLWTYKCRVDLPCDFYVFKEAYMRKFKNEVVLEKEEWARDLNGYINGTYGAEFCFKSPYTLKELLSFKNECVDCHVLFETLEREENYTGDRKYGRH